MGRSATLSAISVGAEEGSVELKPPRHDRHNHHEDDEHDQQDIDQRSYVDFRREASVLSLKFALLMCHPDRSEAEWRDLLFQLFAPDINLKMLCREL
jgi:hypothetical protein